METTDNITTKNFLIKIKAKEVQIHTNRIIQKNIRQTYIQALNHFGFRDYSKTLDILDWLDYTRDEIILKIDKHFGETSPCNEFQKELKTNYLAIYSGQSLLDSIGFGEWYIDSENKPLLFFRQIGVSNVYYPELIVRELIRRRIHGNADILISKTGGSEAQILRYWITEDTQITSTNYPRKAVC